MDLSRRKFIEKASAAGAVAISIPRIVSAASGKNHLHHEPQAGNTILFQGDSITDWGREWNSDAFSTQQNLGTGYVLLTSAQLMRQFPDKNLKIFNKGVSGNKVFQLRERWDKDCIGLSPDILSIMIGVNDYWHTVDSRINYKGSAEIYERDYRSLLQYTMEKLPGVRLIIGEPFALKGVKHVNESWFPEFDKYRAVSQKMAHEFHAAFIPFQSIMDEALKHAPAAYWSADGVHPSLAGNALMAYSWMNVFLP